MAGSEGLSALRRQLGPVLLGVLVLHVLLLFSLQRLLDQGSVLQTMTEPLFTRMLEQNAPAAVSAAAPAPSPGRDAAGMQPAPSTGADEQTRTFPKPAPLDPAARTPAPSPQQAERAAPSPVNESSGAAASAAAPGPPASAPAAAASPGPSEALAALPASAALAQAPARAASAGAQPGAGIPGGTAAPLGDWPTDTRLSYRMTGYYRGAVAGNARVQWLRKDSAYEARIEIEIPFIATLTLTSQGEVTPGELRPKAYEESRRGSRRWARIDDRFVTLLDGRALPRPDGVQDTASQFVALSHRFATGRDTLEVGRAVSLWLARPGGLDQWTYDVTERETLYGGKLGAIDAYHLKPRPIANPRGNITAEMWFAPTLQYLPVRIRIALGDEAWVDLMVDKIEQR